MQLADDIYDYYRRHASELGDDKLFHFATRMYAWRGDPWAREKLIALTETITRPDQPLTTTITDIINTPQSGQRNAHELRQPYFEKYPLLYGAHLALFRVRHLKAVYGIDATPALFAAAPKESLLYLRDALLADEGALRILSTFAINYLYLLNQALGGSPADLPVKTFLQASKQYDLHNQQNVQLLIYLYTHCIIGDSNFYTAEIAPKNMPVYRVMLEQLQQIITANFTDINLDNKLEFLVCARICHFVVDSALTQRIYDECETSISPDGTFLIDVHNTNKQEERHDFIKSEHRNVLFIMSTSPYTPHSTLVS